MNWQFVYEEEHFDANGYCSAGILSNGSHFLFFNVSSDSPSDFEKCRIYDSISFCEESLMCEFDWIAENESLVLSCLNGLSDEMDYCGEFCPLKTLSFVRVGEKP